MVASMFGGVNIEEVFKSSPDSIYTDPIDITKGSLPSAVCVVTSRWKGGGVEGCQQTRRRICVYINTYFSMGTVP